MKTALFLALPAVFLAANASARDLAANPATIKQQIASLQPGDVLSLAPGIYPGAIWLKGLHGRENAPITLRGAGEKTVILGTPGTNSIDLTDCSWLVIRDLTFDGQNKQVDAIKAGKENVKGCHHITIENNTIVNHGATQQIVAISTKSPASYWIIRRNVILGAGTGLYLGNSDGNDPFTHGLIEFNLVADTVGYCMQIKHQNSRAKIATLPTEPGTTIIRYNTFIKNDRPSPDGNRPNLLVGGFPDEGPGADDRYQIYGNFFFHNARESLLQATGRVTIHDNVFADVTGNALLVAPHSGKNPKQVLVYRNTFLQVGRPLSISSAPANAVVVAANLSVGERNPSAVWPAGNVRLTATEAAKLLIDPTPRLGRLDPQPRRAIPTAVPPELRNLLKSDADSDRDFWAQERNGTDSAGACRPSQKPHPLEAKLR